MYRVLMAVDDDEEQLEKQINAVSDLPDHGEISVAMLYVHEEVNIAPDEAGSRVIESINENLDKLQDAPDIIETGRDKLTEQGIDVEISTGKGDPASVILNTAADNEANVICVGGGRRSSVGKAMFGSIAQSVILDSERPVIVAR